MKKRTVIELSVFAGLVLSLVLSICNFNSKCDEIRNNVLRFHIVANSDEINDQNLKLKIRDAVLESTKNDFKNCEGIKSAVKTALNQTGKIKSITENVLKDNNTPYTAQVSVKKEYFSTRVYDDFTLPAGVYNSITLTLGKGKGHNWWCVIFPSVCVPASSQSEFDKNISKDGCEIVKNGGKYVVKFKIEEIFEEIKQKIKINNQKK